MTSHFLSGHVPDVGASVEKLSDEKSVVSLYDAFIFPLLFLCQNS